MFRWTLIFSGSFRIILGAVFAEFFVLKFLAVIVIGTVLGFILAGIYAGLLYLLKPILDKLRVVVHRGEISPN